MRLRCRWCSASWRCAPAEPRQPRAALPEQPGLGAGGVCCPRRCSKRLARQHLGRARAMPGPAQDRVPALDEVIAFAPADFVSRAPAALTLQAGPNTGPPTWWEPTLSNTAARKTPWKKNRCSERRHSPDCSVVTFFFCCYTFLFWTIRGPSAWRCLANQIPRR